MNKKLFLSASLFCLCLAVFSVSLFAQGTTTRISGTVTDNGGAVVAGATVTLTNEGTGTELTTETSDSGAYAFDLIQAATYRVTVEKQGFKKFITTGNSVNTNQPATVNVSLEVGDVSATVTVESTVEQVQTSTSGNVGTTIEQKALESLPIFGQRGRNPLDLINFQPGVSADIRNETGGGVHVHGSRDRAFNFTLDGIDINESSNGGGNFTPLRPNPDSIQEFQILTSNFTAELGRSSGAQVTFTTRSGTNRFTGNAFEFYQTPKLNANEYQNNLNRLAKPDFTQHIFGGSLGGPIIKDRLFFFSNIQLLRAKDTALVNRTVYTQSAKNGIFRYVQGGANSPSAVDSSGNPVFQPCSATLTTGCINSYNIAANPTGIGLDPIVKRVLDASPLPNNFSSGDGLNFANFTFSSPQTERQYDFVARFDYKLADNNLFYVRYAQGDQTSLGDAGNIGRPQFPGSARLVDTFRTPRNLAINNRWSPTAKLTNEFIFGFNKFGFKFDTPAEAIDPEVIFGINNTTTTGQLNNSIAVPFGNFTYNSRNLRTLQFVDNITYDFSPHIIKAGINFRFGRQVDDRSSVGGSHSEITPTVDFSTSVNNTFNGPAGTGNNFSLPSAGISSTDTTNLRNTINNLLGRVGNYRLAYVIDPNDPTKFATPGTRYGFTSYYPEYDFYIQDTWRARQNLTIDLGLRWEVKLSPSSSGTPVLVPNRPITIGAAPANDIRFVEGKLFENDLNNFSPSIGFAYDPFKDGKTSVRANYRLSYDRFSSILFANNIFQSTPGNTFQSSNTSFGQGGGLLRNLGSVSLSPTTSPEVLRQPPPFSTNSITLIDPDLVYPEVHSWFLGVQREVFNGTVLEVNYIGKRAVHLMGAYNINQVNINARDTRFSQDTFLQAFTFLRANSAASHPLINALFTGDPNNNAGTTSFRSLVSSTLSASSTGGGVASAALSVSQRLSGTQQMIATTIGNPFFFQPFPQYSGGLNVIDSNDNSMYNGLEIILKRRISRGLGFQFSYTLSKSKDNRSFDPAITTVGTGTGQSAGSTPYDINNRQLNYTYSDFDRRHALQGMYTYELPFGKGQMFASGLPRAVDYIISGWQLAGLINLQSGRPFTVYAGVNTVSNVVSATANCNGCSRSMGSVIQDLGTNYYFTAEQRAMFSTPAPGELGNTGRNFFIGPKLFQMDMSLSKKFKFTEGFNLEFRADAKNVLNSTAFTAPNTNITSTASPFGRIRDSTYTATFARKIQLGLKLNF